MPFKFVACTFVATKLVDVNEVSPATVVADEPKLIAVEPTVTDELAKLLFAIEVAFVKTVPVSLGKVIVLFEDIELGAFNAIYSLPEFSKSLNSFELSIVKLFWSKNATSAWFAIKPITFVLTL